MISIKVLGPGCSNCTKVAEVAQKAVESLGVEANLTKVTDFEDIRKYQILATPGLVINEKVVSAGRIPGQAEVMEWLGNVALTSK